MTSSPAILKIEEDILAEAKQGEYFWADLARKLLDVRANNLHLELVDDVTNKPIKSWEQYVRRLSGKLKPKLSSGSVSTIKAWMQKVTVYEDQLGYDDAWLKEMGSHANILFKVGNFGKDNNLVADDRPLPGNVGTKLGYASYNRLSDEIHKNIVSSTGPEDEWTIADTLQRVNSILGKQPEVQKIWDVYVGENNLVKVQELKIIVGDQEYSCGPLKSVFHLDDFRRITKSPHNSVSGLGD